MDKFEKILREKLQNHDAGMANGAWEQFAQNNLTQFDSFENAVRNKVENHDAGLKNGAYEQFAQRLEQLQPVASWKYYLTGGIAAALLGFGLYYFNSDDSAETKNKVQISENANAIAKNSLTENNSNKTVNPVDNGHETVTITYGNNEPVVVNNDNKVDVPVIVHDIKKDNPIIKDKEIVKVDNNDSKGNKNNEPSNVAIIKPEFTIESAEICQNSDLGLKALNNKTDFETIWMIDGDEVSTVANPRISISKVGTHQIQLVYATTLNGKRVVSESEKTTVNILPLPANSFEISKTNAEAIPEYTLTPEKVTNAAYLWNFGDGRFSTDEVVSHVYKKRGSHPVTLTVTGANGCQAKETSKIEVENDYNLFAPNAFTPNGSGPSQSESFIPAALLVMTDVQFKMSIYDRSGKKIFESSRIDNPWNGINATNGTKCALGAYIWRVEINLPNGGKDEYMGSVTLLE